MTLTRKQRKKKWVLIVGVLMIAGLVPVQASSPNLSLSDPADSEPPLGCDRTEGDDEFNDTYQRDGTCDAGGNCCFGRPEDGCDIGDGGLPSV